MTSSEILDLVADIGVGEVAMAMRAAEACEPRPISQKRSRRSKADMDVLRYFIWDIVRRYKPMTVRQVFYQLVPTGLIEKTEREYKSTVCRLLTEMRDSGDIKWYWIADSTRWMRKPRTYGSMEDMLRLTQQTYRRALWNDQDAYVEIWLEKEALAGVLVEVTEQWDVPLMVTRGYPSLSFLHSAAEAFPDDRPAHLYYFGDHDPSGVDIDRFVVERLEQFAPFCELSFDRIAVTPHLIAELELPTRPTKKTDSRSKKFEGESVEVDAITPDSLRQLCEACITEHIDEKRLKRTLAVEKAERETLSTIVETYAPPGGKKKPVKKKAAAKKQATKRAAKKKTANKAEDT